MKKILWILIVLLSIGVTLAAVEEFCPNGDKQTVFGTRKTQADFYHMAQNISFPTDVIITNITISIWNDSSGDCKNYGTDENPGGLILEIEGDGGGYPDKNITCGGYEAEGDMSSYGGTCPYGIESVAMNDTYNCTLKANTMYWVIFNIKDRDALTGRYFTKAEGNASGCSNQVTLYQSASLTYRGSAWLNATDENYLTVGYTAAAGDSESPTVTLGYPANQTYYNDFNKTIALGMDELGNCTLNDTRFPADWSNGTHYNFLNGTSLSDGNYSIEYYCNDTSGNWANNTFWFFLDTVNATITLNSPLNHTNHSENVDIRVNYYDLNLWRANTSIFNSSGNQVYNNDSGVLAFGTNWYNLSESWDISSLPDGEYMGFMEASDYHTDNEFNESPIVTKDNSSLEYDQLTYELSQGDIIFKFDKDLTIDTRVSTDKWQQEFILDKGGLTGTKTIYMTTTEPILYIPESNYSCHFLLYHNDMHGYWWDCDGLKDPKVTRIDDYNYKIDYTQDTALSITNSMGATNYISTNFSIRLDTVAPTLTFNNSANVNSTLTDTNSFVIDVNGSETLANCAIDWQGTNDSMTKVDSNTYKYSLVTQAENNYTYTIYCNDTANNTATTSLTWVEVDYLYNSVYVSKSGSDSNTGRTSGVPIKSLSKLETLPIEAGATIYFNRGDIWRESFTYSSYSGNSTDWITFGAYGTGDIPWFYGSHDGENASLWTSLGGNKYRTPVDSIVNESHMIFYNTNTSSVSQGNNETAESGLDTNWDFWYNESGNYVVVYHDGGSPETQANGIEVPYLNASGNSLWYFSNRDYMSFEDIGFGFTRYRALYHILGENVNLTNVSSKYGWEKAFYLGAENSVNYTVDNLNCTYCGIRGKVAGAQGENIWFQHTDNAIVRNSYFTGGGGVIINFWHNPSALAEYNIVEDCDPEWNEWSAGVYFDACNDSIARYNNVTSCAVGLGVNSENTGTYSNNITLHNNIVLDAKTSLVIDSNQNNQSNININVSNNTFFRNNYSNVSGLGSDIFIEYANGLVFRDNIITNNYTATGVGNMLFLENSAGKVTGIDWDYNAWYSEIGRDDYDCASYYASFAAFVAGTGFDTNGSYHEITFNDAPDDMQPTDNTTCTLNENSGYVGALPCSCTIPTHMQISSNTTFCAGTYYINATGGADAAINFTYQSANDTVLDCNGARIIGNGTGRGIYSEDNYRVTIKNCNLSSYTHGIVVSDSTGNYIHNNYIEDSSSSGSGIYLTVDDTRVENNTIKNVTQYGIFVNSGKSGLNITGNLIDNITSANYYGMYIKTTSNKIKIDNNTITTDTASLRIHNGSYNINVTNNNFIKSNNATEDTIIINDLSYGIIIKDNTISGDDQGTTTAISTNNTEDITLQNNTINDFWYGTKLYYISNYTIYNNSILSGARPSSGTVADYPHAIYINNTGSENNISNNYITGHYVGIKVIQNYLNKINNNVLVNTSSTGIWITDYANTTLMDGNILDRIGWNSFAVGQYSDGTNITNNVITQANHHCFDISSADTTGNVTNLYIYNNACDEADHCMYVNNASRIDFLNNNCTNTDKYSIAIDSSPDSFGHNISNNNFTRSDNEENNQVECIDIYTSSVSWSEPIVVYNNSCNNTRAVLLSGQYIKVFDNDFEDNAKVRIASGITYTDILMNETTAGSLWVNWSGRGNAYVNFTGDIRKDFNFSAATLTVNPTTDYSHRVLNNSDSSYTSWTDSAYTFTVDSGGSHNVYYDACTVPVQNLTLGAGSHKLCNGTYWLNDTNVTSAVIILNSNDIVLDCNDAVLRGNDTAASIGIHFNYKTNCTVHSCNIYNYSRGIYVGVAHDATVKDNTIGNFSVYGIENRKGHRVNISNNIIQDSSATTNTAGIYNWDYSDNNTIFNNTIRRVQEGMFFYSGMNNTDILNNTIYDTFNAGIRWNINFSNYSYVYGNTIYNTSWNQLELNGHNHNVTENILYDTAMGRGHNGIDLYRNDDNNSLDGGSGNTIYNNTYTSINQSHSCIYVRTSSNNKIYNNTCKKAKISVEGNASINHGNWIYNNIIRDANLSLYSGGSNTTWENNSIYNESTFEIWIQPFFLDTTQAENSTFKNNIYDVTNVRIGIASSGNTDLTFNNSGYNHYIKFPNSSYINVSNTTLQHDFIIVDNTSIVYAPTNYAVGYNNSNWNDVNLTSSLPSSTTRTVQYILLSALSNSNLYTNKSHSSCSDAYTRVQATNINTPWCSLEAPLTDDKMNSGDILYVAKGEYNGENNIKNWNITSNITISSYPGDDVNLTRYTDPTVSWVNISTDLWYANISGSDHTSSIIRGYTTNLSNKFFTWQNTSDHWNRMLASNYTYQIWTNTTTSPYKAYIRYNGSASGTVPNSSNTKVGRGYTPLYLNDNTISDDAYIIIRGFNIKYMIYGVYVRNTSNVIIEDNMFYGGHNAISVDGQDESTNKLVILRNNTIEGMAEYSWSVTDDIKSSSEETDCISLEDWNGRAEVYDNTFNRCQGAIQSYSDSAYELNGSVYYNNVMYNGTGSQFEIENFCYNSSWYNNEVYECRYAGVSLAPANAYASPVPCNFSYNVISCPYEYRETLTSNQSAYAIKAQSRVSGANNVTNWVIDHNTFFGSDRAMNTMVNSTGGTQEDCWNNVTWTNNIFMAEESQVLLEKGLAENDVFFDYNVYYGKPGITNLFARWNNNTAGVTYDSLALALASPDWDGTWDLNSEEINPSFTTEYTNLTPTDVTVCTMSDTGSYVGAVACNLDEANITINNPTNGTTYTGGTTVILINITTDYNSTCRYSLTNSSFNFADGSNFTITGGTNHTFNLTIENGNTYDLYYKCNRTSSGYVNPTSTYLTFSVDNDVNITVNTPTNGSSLSSSTTTTTINITTSQNATCRYNTTNSSFNFADGTNFTITGGTNHTFTQAVTSGTSYTFYYKCNRTGADAVNVNSTYHSFSVASTTVSPGGGGGSTTVTKPKYNITPMYLDTTVGKSKTETETFEVTNLEDSVTLIVLITPTNATTDTDRLEVMVGQTKEFEVTLEGSDILGNYTAGISVRVQKSSANYVDIEIPINYTVKESYFFIQPLLDLLAEIDIKDLTDINTTSIKESIEKTTEKAKELVSKPMFIFIVSFLLVIVIIIIYVKKEKIL